MLYSAAIAKPQNPYDPKPHRPILPAPKGVPPKHNQSFVLPRFPPPNPYSDKPCPSKLSLPIGPVGVNHPLAPWRADARDSVKPAPRTPGKGSHLARTTQSIVPSSSHQGNYDQLIQVSPASGGIIETLSDIPTHKDFGKLTIEQVVDCLRLLRLERHAEAFRTRFVDGMIAQCLTDDMLVSEFNFRPFEAIQFVKFAKDGWRPK